MAGYLGIDVTTDLYLTDLFGVAGSQGSVNYVDNPPVGEVPYSCLWTARGVLREDPEADRYYRGGLVPGRASDFWKA